HHDHSCIRCTAYREFPLSEQNNLSSMNPFIFSFNAETRQHESPFFTPQKLLRCETEFKFIKYIALVIRKSQTSHIRIHSIKHSIGCYSEGIFCLYPVCKDM